MDKKYSKIEMTSKQLSARAKAIRMQVVNMVYEAQSSHIACSLGIVDILVALYFDVMKINPKNSKLKTRDKFILSKGHACSALYATLAEKGYFDKKKLLGYCQNGSFIAGHVTYGSLPGIENTAGSLGHGLSVGVGMALAAKKDSKKSNTYVLIGDGEAAEGSIWEAILFAGYHKLNNLTMIIDNNDFQIMGKTTKILDLFPLEDKLKASGWDCILVDGNNISKTIKALKKFHPNKPLAIIAKTVKGKGVSFMEGKCEWHGRSPTENEYKFAINELRK